MNIYEHGIESAEIITNTSLRRIATTEYPTSFGFTLTILDLDGKSLNERSINIVRSNPNKPRASADYNEESDLQHCVSSMLYHLDRIVEMYVRITRLFEELHPNVTEGNTGDQRIFFEVEAFFDAARRVYDTIRKVLWKHYGRGSDRWSSIFTVPKMPHRVPPEFITLLEESLSTFGRQVKAYRDCVAHCDPLTDGVTTVWTSGYLGHWGATVRLPKNPTVTTRSLYDFENGPDALSYGHLVACHLIELCEELSKLEAIRTHLEYPERAEGWIKLLHDNRHLHQSKPKD